MIFVALVGCQNPDLNIPNDMGTAPLGAEMVDLGLPSGIKWANLNVGASSPEGFGSYLAWGETAAKTNYSWSTYRFGSASNLSKYVPSALHTNSTVDQKSVLEPEDDAAHVNWKGSWRMPTYAEWLELEAHCTWTWISQNGVAGYEVTGPSGKSIFLPATGCRDDIDIAYEGEVGYYWSSTLLTNEHPTFACCVGFDENFVEIGPFGDRNMGMTVRPVSR